MGREVNEGALMTVSYEYEDGRLLSMGELTLLREPAFVHVFRFARPPLHLIPLLV